MKLICSTLICLVVLMCITSSNAAHKTDLTQVDDQNQSTVTDSTADSYKWFSELSRLHAMSKMCEDYEAAYKINATDEQRDYLLVYKYLSQTKDESRIQKFVVDGHKVDDPNTALKALDGDNDYIELLINAYDWKTKKNLFIFGQILIVIMALVFSTLTNNRLYSLAATKKQLLKSNPGDQNSLLDLNIRRKTAIWRMVVISLLLLATLVILINWGVKYSLIG